MLQIGGSSASYTPYFNITQPSMAWDEDLDNHGIFHIKYKFGKNFDNQKRKYVKSTLQNDHCPKN